jgi:hypothetical protein
MLSQMDVDAGSAEASFRAHSTVSFSMLPGFRASVAMIQAIITEKHGGKTFPFQHIDV